jgi:ribosomal protein S7
MRETITLLSGMSDDDRYDRELRDAAKKTAAALKKKADTAK